jgi:hypothetical protein
LVPTGAEVGPTNEVLLLELARRGMVVQRPVPADMNALHAAQGDGRLLYLGTRGQLDPSRGQAVPRRVLAASFTALGLALRRVTGKPFLWLRCNTLRPKRPRDPIERLLAPLYRALAREVTLADAATLVDDEG